MTNRIPPVPLAAGDAKVPDAPRAPRQGFASRLPPILLAFILFLVGILGDLSIDFGNHWDEPKLLSSLQQSFRTGILLPHWYNYPSLSYDLGLLAAGPHLAAELLHSWRANTRLTADPFVRYLADPAFLLRIRFLFFLLTLSSAVPVYLLIRRLSGSGWAALFGGLTLVSSFEFVSQARWFAPDGLLAALVSWCLLGQSRLLDADGAERRLLWAALSAGLAGLCIGAKYPGGVILIPLLLAVALSQGRTQALLSRTLLLAVGSLLLSAAVFVLSTPGSLLEPSQFLADVRLELYHYRTGHGG